MAGHSNNPKRHRKQRHDNDSNNTTNERVDPDECITQAASVLAAIETRPEDAADLLETEVHNVSSFPTYRRMVGEMIRWWKINYPVAYEQFVYELSDAEKNNRRLHFYNATHDLRYDLLQPIWVQRFISGAKKWKDAARTTQYAFDTPRKYHDAILKCAGVTKYNLPSSYRMSMTAFLDNLKIEKNVAKGNCQLDEGEADPISIGLFHQICVWAIAAGSLSGIFIWAFSVVQWNIIGRTVNVDPLGFHNIRKSQHDSIVIQYDNNKMDKKGEKVSPKNCYANPTKPETCIALALGVYLCVNQSKFNRVSDKLFQGDGTKKGSASCLFSKALKKLINSGKTKDAEQNEERQKIVNEHCRSGHFHPHGFRKGAATHVTTCTMEPPPIPSVLMRGEWSVGKVLEVYWKYSMVGDTYLGRCLAGFNPDECGFGILPPHFTAGTENVYVKEGMRLCFGIIIDGFVGTGIEGTLLLLLASIVYHTDTFLLPHIANNKSHTFLNIPLLAKPDLLKQLQELVTIEPAGAVMQATGVPRSSILMEDVAKMYGAVQEYQAEIRELKTLLPEIIKNAIEDKATESGQVTATFVMERLNDAFEGVTSKWDAAISKTIESTISRLGFTPGNGENIVASEVPRTQTAVLGAQGVSLYPSYKYQDPNAKGRNVNRTDWDVPSDFAFPTADLYVAWTAWLLGYPLNRSKKATGQMYSTPVKPLHLLRHSNARLPSTLKKKFDNYWRPILELMHGEVDADIRQKPVERIDDAFIKATYAHALKSICLKDPDVAHVLKDGRQAVSTCSKVLRACATKKRKVSQMSAASE